MRGVCGECVGSVRGGCAGSVKGVCRECVGSVAGSVWDVWGVKEVCGECRYRTRS